MKKGEILLCLTALILAALVYYRLTINALNLTTGMLFLVALCLSIFWASETALRITNQSQGARNSIRLLLITMSLLLIVLELFLRFGLNTYATYAERNGSKNYRSVYASDNPSVCTGDNLAQSPSREIGEKLFSVDLQQHPIDLSDLSNLKNLLRQQAIINGLQPPPFTVTKETDRRFLLNVENTPLAYAEIEGHELNIYHNKQNRIEKKTEFTHVKTEFTHVREVNSLGLREREVDIEKAPDEYRIIGLGDSFTEGVGTSYDSTWLKVMERSLASMAPHRKITTINAGIGGSDPFFEYNLLKEKLLPFQPDLVVVAMNTSDVNDIIMRGGMERFQPDGSVMFDKKAPGWEWVYGISYIFRHLVHDLLQYNFLFIREDSMGAEELKAVANIKQAVGAFEKLAGDNGFDILSVFHPSKHEVEAERYLRAGLDGFVAEVTRDPAIHAIDLLEYYRVNNIMTKENASDFFWKLDYHNNTKGYQAMGNAIAHKIVELQLID